MGLTSEKVTSEKLGAPPWFVVTKVQVRGPLDRATDPNLHWGRIMSYHCWAAPGVVWGANAGRAQTLRQRLLHRRRRRH
eukprot:scaffold41188_cov36-Phaeocystis_antarctica.AAC.1